MHIKKELFSEEGLHPGEGPAETGDSEKQGCQSAFMECKGSTGRVTGRFVSGNVLNLSHRVLSEGEVSLLSKGLKFSPTPTDLNKAQLKADLDIFKRRMGLCWFFRDTDSNNLDKNSLKFKCKSSWSPSNTDPLLESYLAQFEKEVLSVQAEGKYHSNLSSSELTALNNLKCDRNIVIKEADKGSAVVVWDRGDYLEEANRQLGDRQVNEEIEVDPTIELGKAVKNRIDGIRVEDPGLMEVNDFLKDNEGKLGRFYLLPKIHKGFSGVKGSWPIISNCGTIREKISVFLDQHLNPLVSLDKSYIKDTNHKIRHISRIGSHYWIRLMGNKITMGMGGFRWLPLTIQP